MQYQVPQNIAMEDRIVGPLTAIQFGIIVLGWGAAFVVFTSFGLPSPINTIAGGGIALITAVLAVGKFNDQPLYRFIKYVIVFIFQPKIRVWHKERGKILLVRPTTQKSDQQKHHEPKKVSKQDMNRLAKVLDSRGQSALSPNINPASTPSSSFTTNPVEPPKQDHG